MTSLSTTSPIANAPPVPQDVVSACCALVSPVLIAHVVPDADALGSMLGVARAITREGCRPTVSIPEGSLSQRLSFLEELAGVPIATDADFDAADGFIVLDTAKQPRCNVGRQRSETDWVKGRPVINIDHHGTNTMFGTTNWIVESASSAAELAYRLIVASKREITPAVASLFYAGILTDTLGFSLPTTSASTFFAAGKLVEAGADVAALGEKLGRSQTQSEFDLLRIIYANTKRTSGGRVAYSFATNEEILGAGCTAADIDDQINVPRSLDGVELAMLFSEGHKGKTRINFRGSGVVTVVGLAGEFGGGGHAQASGAILDCGVAEAIARVLPRAEEFIKQFS